MNASMFEDYEYGTLVTVKAGFCGREFKGIVMYSLAAHKGFSDSFLDSTMFRVAELKAVGVMCSLEVVALHQWVPCELMIDPDDSRTSWTQTMLRDFFRLEPKP